MIGYSLTGGKNWKIAKNKESILFVFVKKSYFQKPEEFWKLGYTIVVQSSDEWTQILPHCPVKGPNGECYEIVGWLFKLYNLNLMCFLSLFSGNKIDKF